uniref:Secreted protein n=1 Tax=Anguilla anguilla TaxID=7936 RepID=A0A0E9WFZ6_ANGAN
MAACLLPVSWVTVSLSLNHLTTSYCARSHRPNMGQSPISKHSGETVWRSTQGGGLTTQVQIPVQAGI